MHNICSPEFLSFVSRRQSNNFLVFFIVPATSTSTRYGWLEISAFSADHICGRGFNCRAISIKISMFLVFMRDSNLSEGSFWCSSHNANISTSTKHRYQESYSHVIHTCVISIFFLSGFWSSQFFFLSVSMVMKSRRDEKKNG